MSDIQTARARLVIDHTWLTSLLYALDMRSSPEDQTLSTDGHSITYNPSYLGSLSLDETVGVLSHELLHVGMLHPWRRNGRSPGKWNEACDHAVNLMLLAAGICLPEGHLADKQYAGMTAEQIYYKLPDHDRTCSCLISDRPESEAPPGIKEAMAEALTKASSMGIISPNKAEAIMASLSTRVGWRDILSSYLTRYSGHDDYTYAVLSRRGRALGLNLPGTYADAIPALCVCIDTSASMDDDLISRVIGEIRHGLVSLSPMMTVIIESDNEVRHVTEIDQQGDWTPSHIHGRGGTDFRPAITAAEKYSPPVIIYITDMDGTFPLNARADLIWITESDIRSPIGETIRIQGDDDDHKRKNQ